MRGTAWAVLSAGDLGRRRRGVNGWIPRAPAAAPGVAHVALPGAVGSFRAGGAAAGGAGPWRFAFGLEPAGGAFGPGVECLAGGHQDGVLCWNQRVVVYGRA